MQKSTQSMIEEFFIFGPVPVNAETGAYIPYLVILSYIIAFLGAFTGLQLAIDIRKAPTEILKDRFHMAGAFVFGAGIWAMHFIGMLAYKMRMEIAYDPFLTGLSMVIAVAIAYGVLQIARIKTLRARHVNIGSLLLGAAICGMHYTGMAAMRMDADLRYIPSLFFLSVVIAVIASGAALWMVFTLGLHRENQKFWWQILAAMIMGAAICGMHYTGMAASVFIPYADCRYDPEQQFGFLALVIAAISSGIFAMATILKIRQDREKAKETAKHSVLDQKEKSADPGHVIFLQLGALMSLLMLLFLGSYLYVLNAQIKKIDEGALINGSGLQRALIQYFAREIITVIVSHTDNDKKLVTEHRETAERIRKLIEENFSSFLNGGNIALSISGERRHFVEPIPFERARIAIKKAEQEWKILKKMSESALEMGMEANADTLDYTGISRQAAQTVKAQDDAVYVVEEEAERSTRAVILMQQVALISSLACFFITLAYARYRISLPVSAMYETLKDHQENLEGRVASQTADLVAAKENAERLNAQMQDYTDRLEEIRLEQMDVNARLRRETETIGLLARITNTINESNDVEQAIQICLNEVCAFTGWSIGHAYLLDEGRDKLVPSKSWFLKDKERFGKFRELTEKIEYVSGEGIPGLVYETREYYRMEVFPNSERFPRAGLAKNIGIKAAMGFPILIGKHVSAVIEFFVDDIREPEEDLRNIILNIGTQLGRIIERENIRKAKREAEKANQAKSEFLANMSHELRTPLNSIIGLSKILAEDAEKGSEEQEMNGTIYKAASSLLEIVNDILDLSKIEAGGIVLEAIGFDLKETVSGVLETLGPMASAKGLSLNYRYESENLPCIKGDPVRVGRILTNLVGNAIKYTSDGRVDIIINHEPIEENRIMVSCRVIDTGIGIPEDKLERIFLKFTQADETTTRKYGGTGLGLAITKDLVEMMGGQIGVESKTGRGSSFWFRIPFEITKEICDGRFDRIPDDVPDMDKSIEKIPVENARILVAEDHELNQSFIKKLLGRKGFAHYDLVENGVKALKAFRENAYDAILMDCHMPEMNGYQATGRIREMEKETGNHIPIIALTADAMAGTKEKCLAAGMDDYIAKPIDAGRFKLQMSRWFLFPVDGVKKIGIGAGTKETTGMDFSFLDEYADTREEKQAFCNTFLKKTEESVRTLEDLCTDGENQAWVEISHQIKGSAGMIGATEMARLCAQAQAMENVSGRERQEKIRAIRLVYENVKTVIEREIMS